LFNWDRHPELVEGWYFGCSTVELFKCWCFGLVVFWYFGDRHPEPVEGRFYGCLIVESFNCWCFGILVLWYFGTVTLSLSKGGLW
jgi:hypothetical protein